MDSRPPANLSSALAVAEQCNATGIALAREGQLLAAEQALRQAMQTAPPDSQVAAQSRFNLALVLLLTGRYAEGWPLFEYRHRIGVDERPSLPPSYVPWQGQPLAGRSLLVLREQGYGDELQFVRYLAVLAGHGVTRITYVCEDALYPLLRELSGPVIRILPRTGTTSIEHHDYWTMAMSLAGLCGTTVATMPATLPYLRAPVAHRALWHQRLPTTGLRIGLCWRGSGAHHNDAQRSLPALATLGPVLDLPGCHFVSLQKGDSVAAELAGCPAVLNLGDQLQDFADTAAVIEALDLVITVDTAVAHLSGALGCRTFVLLPAYGLDWRWLTGRDDSPWYPGVMRLFRQPAPGDWQAPVAQLATAIHAMRDPAGSTGEPARPQTPRFC